jgi:hypothetical protein
MHHKRGKARNQRAGCKLCKPWKVNGYRNERAQGERFGDHRRRDAAARATRDVPSGSNALADWAPLD